jgi:hypothetical protein
MASSSSARSSVQSFASEVPVSVAKGGCRGIALTIAPTNRMCSSYLGVPRQPVAACLYGEGRVTG